MIRDVTASRLDSTDRCLIEQLRNHIEGCRIGPLVEATMKSEGAIRYRMLTLEVCGVVRAVRERGATTYFLGDNAKKC